MYILGLDNYFQVGKETIPFINVKTWKELTNLGGVRIEDTIVITSKGHKNLSKVPEEMGYLLYICYIICLVINQRLNEDLVNEDLVNED